MKRRSGAASLDDAFIALAGEKLEEDENGKAKGEQAAAEAVEA